MSNHVWTCEHGVEFGQGCTEVCGPCEQAKEERNKVTSAKSNREFFVRIAFDEWIRNGNPDDWRKGVRFLAKQHGLRLDVMEDNDPARPACSVCN